MREVEVKLPTEEFDEVCEVSIVVCDVGGIGPQMSEVITFPG